jgi:hypothetical protein
MSASMKQQEARTAPPGALCRLMSAEQKQQPLDEASAAMQGVPDAI